MFDKFGEFDSAEEMNELAQNLFNEGDIESIKTLAAENGLGDWTAANYIEGYEPVFVDAAEAAIGKIEIEQKELKPKDIMVDWCEYIKTSSMEDEEMLALPDEDMEMLTPEMKRSDIRALKEFNRQEPEAPDTESWILEMMEIIPAEVKKDLAKECLQGALDGRKCSDIINPSGNSMKRTRAAMVAMTEEGLFVKTFGPEGGRRKISWQDFAKMLCERYEKWKPQKSTEKPEENTRPATENAQHTTENAQSATEDAQSEQENAHPEQDPDQEAQEAEEPAGEEEQPAEGDSREVMMAEGVDPEETPEEGTDQETESEETELEKPAEIMPAPEESEPIAPAQKPAESKTYQDAKAMMKGLNNAFAGKDWDRMLSLLEGLEPAIRKLKKEE